MLQEGSWGFVVQKYAPRFRDPNWLFGNRQQHHLFFYNMPGEDTAPRRWRWVPLSPFKKHKSFSWCKSPALGVLVFKWASQVWSPMRWQSPRRPTSMLGFPLDRSMPNASTSGAPTYLHVLLCLFLESRPECGPSYLSYHFADKYIFILCLVYLNVNPFNQKHPSLCA